VSTTVQCDTVLVTCIYLAQVESDTLSDLDCGHWWPEDIDGQLNYVQSLELPDLGLLIVWDFHIMEGDALHQRSWSNWWNSSSPSISVRL